MISDRWTCLLIDDEPSLRRTLRTALEAMGHTVTEAASGPRGPRTARQAAVRPRLPRPAARPGVRARPAAGAAAWRPGLGVVVITAYATIDTAVEAMRRGAFDYLPKPFTPDQLRVVLDRWRLVSGLRSEVADLREQVREAVARGRPGDRRAGHAGRLRRGLPGGRRPRRRSCSAARAAPARACWPGPCMPAAARAGRPFVTVHCPSLSAELLESDLFGHAKGAFTGAVTDTEGKVAAAEGGTLFLDEIGDLPLAVQPKLLRFLQEKAYERVGETRTRHGDVRLIAATNRDLEAEVAGRPVPRGPALPAQRDRGRRCRRCASAAATSCRWPTTCCGSSPGRRARR